jgi:hypothetical protein
VNAPARIERLRSLIAQLEQSAPSRQRDAVLRAARQRVVTVDTGPPNASAWRSNPDDRRDSLALLDH